jgi:hypothetical protein
MAIDRKTLIAAGWTPPEGDPSYEDWREALTVFWQLTDGPEPWTPLDDTDTRMIDILRATFRSAPKEAR